MARSDFEKKGLVKTQEGLAANFQDITGESGIFHTKPPHLKVNHAETKTRDVLNQTFR